MNKLCTCRERREYFFAFCVVTLNLCKSVILPTTCFMTFVGWSSWGLLVGGLVRPCLLVFAEGSFGERGGRTIQIILEQ